MMKKKRCQYIEEGAWAPLTRAKMVATISIFLSAVVIAAISSSLTCFVSRTIARAKRRTTARSSLPFTP